MLILRSKSFKKRYQQLPQKIQIHVKERLALLIQDEFHPLLNNHGLFGKYNGYRSINITGDYRALYKKLADGSLKFTAVGTHSKLYK